MQTICRRVGVLGGVALWAALAIGSAPAQSQQRLLGAGLPPVSLSGPCLRSGKAYFRAHIRGSVRLDVDLRGAELTC
ncbi:MAG: hypothetical protein ACRETJ_13090, partial [Steroidobacteraceae bacterium]